MATQQATPLTTQTQIQAWLDGGDDVRLSGGSVYSIISDINQRSGIGIKIPAGRTLDLNGATLYWAGLLNQTVDLSSSSLVGALNTASPTIINGIIRGPDDRVLPGARANGSNCLLYMDANGIAMNFTLANLTIYNGPNQALQLNNTDGGTVTDVNVVEPSFDSPASGQWLGHYVDCDVTANGRVNRNVIWTRVKFGARKTQAHKLENVKGYRYYGCEFGYTTIIQDQDPYAEIDDVEFDSACRWLSYVELGNLRRRWNGSALDNVGGGNITIRGSFLNDDALIYGVPTAAAIVTAGYAGNQNNADAAMFANLKAQRCNFRGKNSHLVPLPDSTWITRSSGVKKRVTIYFRQSRDPKYLFGVTPAVVKNAVDPSAVSQLTYAVSTSLSATNVSTFYLASRGVTVEIDSSAPWTGANNTGAWANVNANVPVNWTSSGGAAAPFVIDASGQGNVGCMVMAGTNNAKQRVMHARLRNAGQTTPGSSSRGFLVNHANADVELYNVIGENCITTGGGGGGRAQAYASFKLLAGSGATNCQTTGSTNGGGWLIDASSTATSEVEGVRLVGNSAGGGGGALRISSPYCTVKSAEMVNNTAAAGPGGLQVSFSVASVTMSVYGLSGRGNVGSSGNGHDFQAFVGTAGSKVVLRSSVLASATAGSTLVLGKTGSGNIDYGDLNVGTLGTTSFASGTNTSLGNVLTSDPLLVADATSVVLQASSPCKASVTPRWTVGSERPTVAFDGSWFPVNASSKTTMGARP